MPRLLDSLVHLEPGPPFRVLVLVATVHPSLANRAQARVNALIASFRGCYPIAQFGAKELAVVRDWLPARRPLRIGVLAGASSPEVVLGRVLRRLASFLS